MTAQFAGAKSVNERRRRRLAEDPPQEATKAGRTKKNSQSQAEEEASPLTTPRAHYPLRKIVSPRKWKLVAVVLIAAGVAAGLEAMTFWLASAQTQMPGELPVLLNSAVEALQRCFAAVLLVGCALLTGIISWVRSQSHRDYNGTYRVWHPVTLTWLGTAVFIAIDGPNTVAAMWSQIDTILPLSKLGIAGEWLLLLPAAWGFLILWAIHSETRHTRFALGCVWLSAAAWVIAMAAISGLVPAARLADPRVPGWLFTGGLLFMFAALIAHARHVIYESADPPVVANEQPQVEEKPARQKSTREKPARKKPTRKPKVEKQPIAEEPPKREAKPAAAEKPAAKKQEASRKPAAAARVEAGHRDGPDPELLRGLSKRERRQVRKEWREQQRLDDAA